MGEGIGRSWGFKYTIHYENWSSSAFEGNDMWYEL